MKPKMKALSAALAHALSAGTVVSLAATVAHAQTPATTQKIEKIEVTGSNIKRVDTEGASPIQIIGREAIERSGATNAMEIPNLGPANQVNVQFHLGRASLDIPPPDKALRAAAEIAGRVDPRQGHDDLSLGTVFDELAGDRAIKV